MLRRRLIDLLQHLYLFTRNHATQDVLPSRMVQKSPNETHTYTCNHSRLAAITRVVLASDSQVAQYLDDGFTKVDKNLLQQSNRGAVYIMYKRGSGVRLDSTFKKS